MDVSICILTRIQDELLQRCVASCLAEVERAGLSAEIIIIDNASANGAPQRAARLSPLVRVMRNEENLAFSKANNAAARTSRGLYVLILNDDTEFCEGALGLMVRTLDSARGIGAVGPKLINPDGSVQTGCTHKRFPHLRGIVSELLRLDRIFARNALTRDLLTLRRDEDCTADAEQLSGACLLVKREALDSVGLFDEGFNYYFEDTDLCYRLKKAGWQLLYLAEARIRHYGSASFKGMMRSTRSAIFLGSLVYFFRKHATPGRFLLFKLVLSATLCLRIPVAVLMSFHPSTGHREKWRGTIQTHMKLLRSLLFA